MAFVLLAFWVNVLAILLQTFVASRLVRHFGIAGVLFAFLMPAAAEDTAGVTWPSWRRRLDALAKQSARGP